MDGSGLLACPGDSVVKLAAELRVRDSRVSALTTPLCCLSADAWLTCQRAGWNLIRNEMSLLSHPSAAVIVDTAIKGKRE